MPDRNLERLPPDQDLPNLDLASLRGCQIAARHCSIGREFVGYYRNH